MTEPEHKRRLRINRPFIVENLLCVDEVLDHILSEEVFSEAIVEDIRQKNQEKPRIRAILDSLDKRTRDKFDKFCSILDKTNNDLIAARLRNSTASYSSQPPINYVSPPIRSGIISDKDQKVFQTLHVEFVENMLDVAYVVDSLMSQELLNQGHRSLIFECSTRRQQVRQLMNILPKKGNRALPALLVALKASGDDYLYEKILCTKSKQKF